MDNEDNEQEKKSRKPSKLLIYFLIIILVIWAEGFVLLYDYANYEDSFLEEVSLDYPVLNTVLKEVPTNHDNSSSFDLSKVQKPAKKIGNNSLGTVTLEGPYGNESSSVKVAYILGQHPRESNAHDAIYNGLLNASDNLSYAYYVYRINVTAESEDFEESRMNGQLLAQEFVVNDTVDKGYNLAIDVHASNGGYVPDPYIFAPVPTDKLANESANNVTKAINYIIYYEPASYSSPQYSTIPIDEGGVPAVVFEMRGNPNHSLETEANQFVHTVDKLFI